MKKAFFTTMVALAFCMPMLVQAQTPASNVTSYATMIGNVQKSLVRVYQYPGSISYVETVTNHYFVYYDGVSNMATTVSISSIYSVNDLVIAGDTVYFCGSRNGMAFLGHFNIQDFFINGPQSYYVTNFAFQSSSGSVSTFDRMVTYLVGSERRLAMIGKTQTGLYVSVGVRYNPIAQSCAYEIGELNTSYNESLLGIAATDNYVITAGFLPNGTAGNISVRVYRKPNMFVTTGPQNTVSVFASTSSTVATFDATQLVISHLMGDEIGLATYYKGPNSMNNQGLYLGKYGVGLNYNINNSYSGYYIPSNMNGSEKLQGLGRINSTDNYYLIHNYVDGSGMIWSEICMVQFPSIFSVSQKTDIVLQSIDALGGGTDYVANGSWITNPTRLIYNYGIAMPAQCWADDSSANMTLFLMNKQNPNQPFVVTTGSGSNFLTLTGTKNPIPAANACTE